MIPVLLICQHPVPTAGKLNENHLTTYHTLYQKQKWKLHELIEKNETIPKV